jgi:hypothetical protein
MNLLLRSLIASILFSGGALATESAQPQVSFTPGSSDTWNMDWNGIAGRTYFIQWSMDLIDWNYVPTMEFGEDPEPYGFQTEGASKFFVRLRYIDADWITTLQEAKNADFDGDKVSNFIELENGTDPFQSLDTDGDGMPNDWETAHGLNPLNPSDVTLDQDSDGNSNSQEFQQNTDPGDYASRILLLIAIFDGNAQESSPSVMLPKALEVRVTDTAGIPLANVPLTFRVTTGNGQVAGKPGDTPATSVNLFTDKNGACGALYIQPNGFDVSSSITATVTSGPNKGVVTFSAHTVVTGLSNDNFVNAQAISGEDGSVNSTNTGATVEANEPIFLSLEFGAESPQGGSLVRQTGSTVWFSWQAPATGRFGIQTGSVVKVENDEPATYFGNGTDFDTVLAVYQGSTLSTLSFVAGSDDGGTVESAVEFDANSGQTYFISVDGAEGQAGNFFLSWYPVAPAAPPGPAPANDAFSNAVEIFGIEGAIVGSTVDATKESGESDRQYHEGTHSIWYRWLATETGTVDFDTAGSRFNTILGVYQGMAVDALTEIAWNDDNETLRARVSFATTAGQIYYIMVDGFGNESGPVNLSWVGAGRPPGNDDFLNSSVISSDSGVLAGSIRWASAEVSEPSHAGRGPSQSVWYQWTAPESDTYTFHTEGSAFDTVLAVYAGASVNALTNIAFDDDGGEGQASLLSFSVVQGTTYSIAIDAYGGVLPVGQSAEAVLNWMRGIPEQSTNQLQAPEEPEAKASINDAELFQSSANSSSSPEASESEGMPNKGDTFVSEEDQTIVLLAPRADELSVACPVPFTVEHSIGTFDTPRARDLNGKLRLFVEGDASLISLGDYTPGTAIDVTEPGHFGDGVHDWHMGYEDFNITALKKGSLTLRAEVDPDSETPEGDGEPRTKATINVQILDVTDVIIYHPTTSSDADWQSAAKALRWNQIVNKNEPLKIKLVLSGTVPENNDVDLCSLKIALFKFDENSDSAPWTAPHSSHRLSPSRSEIWVTIDAATVEAELARFNSSENEFASIEAPGSSSFADSNVFDGRASALANAKKLVLARDAGNETDTARTVGGATIPSFTAQAPVDYPRYGGAVYLQVQMINTRSKRRLYRNQADILYISSHGTSRDGAIASVVPGSVDWSDDLEIVIMAGCSVLDINDYNGNYDNDGDGDTEPGPSSHVFSGEHWAKTGPKTLLGYNYKAPLDTQGTPGIINSWFDNRGVGDIEAWKTANNNSSGRNACAIDANGGTYYYFKRSGRFIKSYVWTAVSRASW